jgi:hypothetical protein
MELAKMIKQLFLAIFLSTISAVATSAQSSAEQAAKNARDQFTDIKNRSIEIERVKRGANKRTTSDNSTPKFPEIKEDFEQIQKISSDVFQLTVIKTPINYNDVLKFVSEINHRAVRLKSNLFSSEPKQKREAKNKQQIVADQQDVKILLDALDKSINSFVHSSIFQNVNIVNSQDSLNAQNDLELVIQISSSIMEKAKKLIKDNLKK